MDERQWEKRLRISTMGRDAARSDAYRYPYEPTPYCVLQRLADSGYLTEDSVLVDYGCGKGRAGIFLHHVLGCRTVGIEYDPAIYRKAVENLRTYGKSGVEFRCIPAEQYLPADADCCYFFNPFSLQLLQTVYGKILESYYGKPRTLRLFFYYPSEAYTGWLMTRPELQYLDELDCTDLFPGSREKILVMELPGF